MIFYILSLYIILLNYTFDANLFKVKHTVLKVSLIKKRVQIIVFQLFLNIFFPFQYYKKNRKTSCETVQFINIKYNTQNMQKGLTVHVTDFAHIYYIKERIMLPWLPKTFKKNMLRCFLKNRIFFSVYLYYYFTILVKISHKTYYTFYIDVFISLNYS